MLQAMYSAISGLNAFKSSLDVIGNNIANVETTAYKSQKASFQEALTQTLSGASGPTTTSGGKNAVQVGLGVSIGTINTNVKAGSMQSTGVDSDLAIAGNGYFMLNDNGSQVYTRDGSFTLDAQNNLVSSTGMRVLGWIANQQTGEIDANNPITTSSSLNIPIGTLATATQTSSVDITGNLDKSETVGESKTIEGSIYDSLGVTHDLSIEFTKENNDDTTGNSVWSYVVTCPDVTGTIASGSISFNDSGYSETSSIPLSISFDADNGSVQPLDLTLDTSGITQLSGDYTVSESYQDGLPLGTLSDYSIGSDGIITGTFTNGATRALGQIAIAQFTNPAGLDNIGGNVYRESPNSGSVQISAAGAGSAGSISSGYLESSNVDLATEFSNMIVAQRGFQANSKIITTSNDILETMVSMIR